MRVRLFPVLIACSALLADGRAAVRGDEPPGSLPTTTPRGRTGFAGTRPLGREPMVPPRPTTSNGGVVRTSSPPQVTPPSDDDPGRRIVGPDARGGLPPALPLATPAPLRIEEPLDREAGGEHPAGPSPLSLAELEALARRNNPTIQAADALVLQQQGLLRQLTRYPNPTAGWVQSTPSRRSEGATQGAFISQDIVTAGKLRVVATAVRERREHLDR